MTSPSPPITGTDIVTVATRGFDAAADFYGDALGRRTPTFACSSFIEAGSP